MDRNKLMSFLFHMKKRHLSFGDQAGCDYFKNFLIANNVNELDLKNKSFYQIVKQYWNLDLSQLKAEIELIWELQFIELVEYEKKEKEFESHEMFKS